MGRFSLDSGWSTGAVFDSHRRACSHGAFGRIKNADRVRWLREAALLALPRDPLLSLILYAVRGSGPDIIPSYSAPIARVPANAATKHGHVSAVSSTVLQRLASTVSVRSARKASSVARTSARIVVRAEREVQVSLSYVERARRDSKLSGSDGGDATSEQPAAVPPPPAGYPMPPEGYPFPYVYPPPMGYVPAAPEGQQPEGSNGAPPAMPHPFYPSYPAIYPHPYGYPGAPPMPYPPLIPAPVAASPNSAAKPDSASATPAANGASASADAGKGKKRSRAKNGEESGRASKKTKETAQGDVQQQLPNGDSGVAGVAQSEKDQHPPPPPQPQPQPQQPPPPPYQNHVDPSAGPGPVAAFGGPEPRPLMAAM